MQDTLFPLTALLEKSGLALELASLRGAATEPASNCQWQVVGSRRFTRCPTILPRLIWDFVQALTVGFVSANSGGEGRQAAMQSRTPSTILMGPCGYFATLQGGGRNGRPLGSVMVANHDAYRWLCGGGVVSTNHTLAMFAWRMAKAGRVC